MEKGALSMAIMNVRRVGRCAFCKYWYDPANSAISPRAVQMGLWEFKEGEKRKCTKKNLDTLSGGYCGFYQCKV